MKHRRKKKNDELNLAKENFDGQLLQEDSSSENEKTAEIINAASKELQTGSAVKVKGQRAALLTRAKQQKAKSRDPKNPGTAICFYFQVHQPFRLRNYMFHEIGSNHFYEDYNLNLEILNKVADKCYLPTNAKILELITRHKGNFKVAYSLTGCAMEQFELYRPDVIRSFQALAASGHVEFLGETYYHSLSFMYSKEEFSRQVELHKEKLKALFNAEPKVFRFSELVFNNELAKYVAALGYKGMLCEGADKWLKGRSPNHVYRSPEVENFSLLLKNYSLSDDIAFRFSSHDWNMWPLTAEKFSKWLHDHADNAETINLFMDYETFGEHQWEETGIFDFLAYLPEYVLEHPDFAFRTPSEVIATYPAKEEYDVPEFSSWADEQRDLSAWTENDMQREAIEKIYSLEDAVKKSGNEDLMKVWGKLQTSDHFYYMSTKFWSDGDVHKYFSHFPSPFDACIYYMNVISDLEMTLQQS